MVDIDKRMSELLARPHGYENRADIPIVPYSCPMISRLAPYQKDAEGKVEINPKNGKSARINDPDNCPEHLQHDYTGELYTRAIVWKFSNRVRSWRGQNRYECFVRLYMPYECEILPPQKIKEMLERGQITAVEAEQLKEQFEQILGVDRRIAAYLRGNEFDTESRKEGNPFILSEGMQKSNTPAMQAYRPPYQLPDGKPTWYADIPMVLILEAYARTGELVFVPRHWSHLSKLVAETKSERNADGDLVTTTKVKELIIACTPVHRRNEPVLQPGYVLALDKKFAKNILDAYEIVYEDGALVQLGRWSECIDLTNEPRSSRGRHAQAKPRAATPAAAPEPKGDAKPNPDATDDPKPKTKRSRGKKSSAAPAIDNAPPPPPPATGGDGTAGNADGAPAP